MGLQSQRLPSQLSRDLLRGVIRERGYFLGVGKVAGFGLFMQVLEGRFLSSLEHSVAAGTMQPLVWGIVGDDHTGPSHGMSSCSANKLGVSYA